MDNVSKALALARLGIKVFPVSKTTKRPKIAEKDGGRGFYDAVADDFEQIATWFSVDFTEADTAVGYWTGGSGLFVADIDTGKKSGKDGFESIKARGLQNDIGKTHSYPTLSGGQHRVFQTDRLDLTLDKDHDGIEGLDIRAGGSYAVWWGDEVPESREAFSTEIPEWMLTVTESEPFVGKGFSGSIQEWLKVIPDDPLPSGRVRDLMERIPKDDFGHPEMVDLAWGIVRMGSERETGIKMALDRLRKEWLRPPYDTPANRRDLDLAIRGAINKAGRVQTPVPTVLSLSGAMGKAVALGIDAPLKALERKVSETDTEIELARARREMFQIAAKGGLSPAAALGIVTGSKAFKNSKVPLESTWFADGEPFYHDKEVIDEAEEAEALAAAQALLDREIEVAKKVTQLSVEAESYSFLTNDEQVTADAYEWFGREYLTWVEGRLKHFNRPYHVGSLWAMLSVIASPWGKVPLSGAKPTDCNLYISNLGDSSTGKTESWEFALGMIDAYYGIDNSPVIGDVSKLSALAMHRSLILRDGEPSLVYGDEVQSFFQGVHNSQWQTGILGDISSHYGGNVSPKLTLNDKEVSGKRAKTLFTVYLTGIADQTLDAISLSHWTNGFFYRFLWGFGNPRKGGDYTISMESVPASYTEQFEKWARELKRVAAVQEVKWGAGRLVLWERSAHRRMEEFKKQIDTATKSSPLYDSVFVNANGRFLTSIMKVATIVALIEASEKVTLDHVLVALSFAGSWHRSMVLAVEETGKEQFDRDVEKCLLWIKRNAVRQIGKRAWVQRSAVMRAFKPNEIAERLLRQLTEEGWLIRSGDIYELTEEVG